ncbi:MAG: hypothetical protein V7L25_21845 [Nostoc sp.]
MTTIAPVHNCGTRAKSRSLEANLAVHKCGMIPPNTGISLYFR